MATATKRRRGPWAEWLFALMSRYKWDRFKLAEELEVSYHTVHSWLYRGVLPSRMARRQVLKKFPEK